MQYENRIISLLNPVDLVHQRIALSKPTYLHDRIIEKFNKIRLPASFCITICEADHSITCIRWSENGQIYNEFPMDTALMRRFNDTDTKEPILIMGNSDVDTYYYTPNIWNWGDNLGFTHDMDIIYKEDLDLTMGFDLDKVLNYFGTLPMAAYVWVPHLWDVYMELFLVPGTVLRKNDDHDDEYGILEHPLASPNHTLENGKLDWELICDDYLKKEINKINAMIAI